MYFSLFTPLSRSAALVRRFMQMTPHLERIEQAAQELGKLNARRYEDNRIDELLSVIETEAAALKE